MTTREQLPARDPAPAVRTMIARIYLLHDSMLGEGPVWDDGVLYWTDIFGKAIHAKPDAATTAVRYDIGLEVGAFALAENGRLVLATEQGFQSFDRDTQRLERWGNPEQALPDNRFNDGKCDPRGRFVAGTLNRQGVLDQGAVYVLDHDRSVRELHRPVSCSNGLAWSDTGTVFYYIDTPSYAVRAFSYDLETCRLSDSRVVIRFPQEHGLPDGMCIDRSGNLWIALWDGWGVECWNPHSGERVARVEVPVAHVTSCAFGGVNHETLFITTARYGLDEQALAQQPLAGSVFCAQPGTAGYPAFRFKDARA